MLNNAEFPSIDFLLHSTVVYCQISLESFLSQGRDFKNHQRLLLGRQQSITTGDALQSTLFTPEFKILYELITIYDLVDKFFNPNSVKAAREAEK